MRIFLVGFMGCGKTTHGRKLANKLNYEFIDLDKLFEDRTGMSIPEYFNRFGEQAFREYERDMLQTYPFSNNVVIATGGGLPCFFDNMAWMNEHGTTVYISMTPEALAARLDTPNVHERPALQNLRGEALVNLIRERLATREQFYAQAQHILDGVNLTAEKIAGHLGASPSG